MKLVADWKKCLKWWSVRGLLVLAALPPIWMAMPPDVKAMVPDGWSMWIVSIIAIGTAAGRLKDQGGA